MTRKPFFLIKFLFIICIAVTTISSNAQQARIAIVNIADTTLLHTHLGTTAFTNAVDTFDCRFNCKNYLNKELVRFLSSRYEVDILTIPDSLIASNGSIINAFGIKKDAKSWISGLEDKYAYLIYIESGLQEAWMRQTSHHFESSGLYSRGFIGGDWAAAYSTIALAAIKTSTLKTIFYNMGIYTGVKKIKNYKFSSERMMIDPEMLPVIKAELTKLMDQRVEYFLTKSFLLPQDAYDSVKMKSE